MIMFMLICMLVIVYVAGFVALTHSCSSAKDYTTKKMWKFILFPICIIPTLICFVVRVLNFLLAVVLLLVGIKYAHSSLYEKISSALDDIVFESIF